jgi:hypothetical protein
MAERRTSEWLDLAAEGFLAVWLNVLAVICLVLVPWWLAVALALLAFRTGFLALEIAVVTLLMLLTLVGVWWAFTGRRVSRGLVVNRTGPTIRTLMVAFVAVASFASLTSLLILEGAIDISETVSQDDVIFDTTVVYVWHLFDTVPLLDIPQNLEWEAPFEFEDSLGGLLVILFTAIVILPLIRVVRAIWVGHREPYEDALRGALRKHLPGWKTTRLPGESGYERALVEGGARILVDVMHDVSTEDAPLRRLEVVRSGLAAQHGAGGYLLVVDAVAERARDRIDQGFEESTLPAELVVWRADEPGTPLAGAVERLAGRVAPARAE